MSGDWVHTSAPYTAPRKPGERDAWSEAAAAQGRRGGQRVVSAEEVPASAEVAVALGLSEGEAVVERRRIIYLDEEIIELTSSYYPARLARGTPLAMTAKIPGGAVTALAGLGRVGQLVSEEVRARLVNDGERHMLALNEGAPVLELVRRTADGRGPFQVDVSVFPAATQRLRYEMKVG